MADSATHDAAPSATQGSSAPGTFFDLFGLPVRFALSQGELEHKYREASRHWHPDRWSRAPAVERAAVLSRATDLNQAYRVLKSDARRAEYLLQLRGVNVASEEPGKQPAMPPEFLHEILELREELLEARAEADAARLASLKKTVQAHAAEIGQGLSDGFSRLEAGDASALAELVMSLLKLRYYQRFLDELEATAEALADAAEATL
jgi:molecular chaperone HscB